MTFDWLQNSPTVLINCVILCLFPFHRLLPDHPKKMWDAELLASKIAESVITENISAVSGLM